MFATVFCTSAWRLWRHSSILGSRQSFQKINFCIRIYSNYNDFWKFIIFHKVVKQRCGGLVGIFSNNVITNFFIECAGETNFENRSILRQRYGPNKSLAYFFGPPCTLNECLTRWVSNSSLSFTNSNSTFCLVASAIGFMSLCCRLFTLFKHLYAVSFVFTRATLC